MPFVRFKISCFGNAIHRQVANVSALNNNHSVILAQTPGQLTIADVHSINSGGPMLKQTIGKAAGRGAHRREHPSGRRWT